MKDIDDLAFPYTPPTLDVVNRYDYIFNLQQPLRHRKLKRLFDILVSLAALVFILPLLGVIKFMFIVEGLFFSESRGPLLIYYNAISHGQVIRKYKIRTIKISSMDPVLAEHHDWRAYRADWDPSSLTRMGSFVKKFYLDEIPQFFAVVIGNMSIVGPRPLSVEHYNRDVAQGNVARKLVQGGLLGLGHIHKGTAEMGDPKYEYEYIDRYINDNALSLLFLDLKIIFKGLWLMLKGGGH